MHMSCPLVLSRIYGLSDDVLLLDSTSHSTPESHVPLNIPRMDTITANCRSCARYRTMAVYPCWDRLSQVTRA